MLFNGKLSSHHNVTDKFKYLAYFISLIFIKMIERFCFILFEGKFKFICFHKKIVNNLYYHSK